MLFCYSYSPGSPFDYEMRERVVIIHIIQYELVYFLVTLVTFGVSKAFKDVVSAWPDVFSTIYSAVVKALDISPPEVPRPPEELSDVNRYTTIEFSYRLTTRAIAGIGGDIKSTGYIYEFALKYVTPGFNEVVLWVAVKTDVPYGFDRWYSYTFRFTTSVALYD